MTGQPAVRFGWGVARRSRRAAAAAWDQLAREKGAEAAAWDEPGDGVDECLAAIGDLADRGFVLDLGCGPGRLLIPYARTNPHLHVHGADASPVMLAAASEAIWESDLPNVTALAHMPLAGPESFSPAFFQAYSGAWSVLMFQHIRDSTAYGYVKRLSRMVNHGGRLRVQFVDADLAGEGAAGPLSHPRTVATMGRWFNTCHFDVTAVDRGLVKPTWTWITGVRR